MKKLYVAVLVFSLGVLLMGCGETLGEDFTDEQLGNYTSNLDTMELDIIEETNSRLVSIGNDYNVIEHYHRQGAFKFTDDVGNQGVYSIYLDDYIIEVDETITHIFMDTSWRYRDNVYFRVNYNDGEYAYYDLMGRDVLPKDNYTYTYISIDIVNIRDENNQVIGREYFETIEYQNDDGYQEARYRIDQDLRINVNDIDDYDEDFSIGDLFDIRDTHALDDYGLEGHKIYFGPKTYTVFNSEGNRVASILRPPSQWIASNPLTAGQIFNGRLMYQEYHKMPDTHDDYDVVIEGEKYLINTYVIDLLSGTRSSIELDYLIEFKTTFPDDDGIHRYGLIAAADISSGVFDNVELELIINSEGEVLKDTSGLQLGSMKNLIEGLYYNTSTRTIFDDNLDIVFELPSTPQFLLEDSLMIEYNTYYGIVNYDGMVTLPFEYRNPTLLPGGVIQATNRYDETVLINKNFEVSILPRDYNYLGLGHYQKVIEGEGQWTFTLINHFMDIQHTINIDNASTYNQSMYTLFYDGVMVRINSPQAEDVALKFIIIE